MRSGQQAEAAAIIAPAVAQRERRAGSGQRREELKLISGDLLIPSGFPAALQA